jgi:hypothetical protein
MEYMDTTREDDLPGPQDIIEALKLRIALLEGVVAGYRKSGS